MPLPTVLVVTLVDGVRVEVPGATDCGYDDDGYLQVEKDDRVEVATFAPGRWSHVVREPAGDDVTEGGSSERDARR